MAIRLFQEGTKAPTLLVGGGSEQAGYREVLERDGFAVDVCGTGEACLKLFHAGSWALVIVHQDLPGMSGLFLLGRIKEIDPACQVILLTDHATVEAAMEARMLGAAEYLPKPLTPDQVSLVAGRALEEMRTTRREREEAGRGPLGQGGGHTVFFGFSQFEQILNAEFARAKRYDQPLSLVVVVLDQIGEYRRVAGDPAADAAVKTVCRLIDGHVRVHDAVSRLGQDAFCILLPHTAEEGAKLVARKLRLLLSEARIEGRERLPGEKWSVSAGVSTFPSDAADPEELLARARHGARQSRQLGGGRVMAAA